MHLKFLILGLLVHGLLLFWSYDTSRESQSELIACPFQTKENNLKRLVITVVRNPNQKSILRGMHSQFFSKIPNVYYFGESLLPMYYDASHNWIKSTYPSQWTNPTDEYTRIIKYLKAALINIHEDPAIFLFVVDSVNEERRMLYIKEEVEGVKRTLDTHYGNNETTCLLLHEASRVLVPVGFGTVATEENLTRYADLVPLVSILLHVDIPYRGIALLPINFIESDKERSLGMYCNALNMLNLAEKLRKTTGLIKRLYKSIDTDMVRELNKTIQQLNLDGNYTGAMYLSKKLLSVGVTSYVTSKRIIDTVALVLLALTLVGWTLLLATEYLKTITGVSNRSPSFMFHLSFILLSLVFLSLPFLLNWPYTYHAYLQTPIFIFWFIPYRINYSLCIIGHFKELYKILLFITLLIFTVEYLISEEGPILPLSICLVGLLPSLAVFRSVPFLFILIWYVLSGLLLISTCFTNKKLKPNMKYTNLTGTIWILLTGVSILWMSPRKDTVLTCLSGACLGVAVWLQNWCLTFNQNCFAIRYCMWPLFTAVTIPLLSKSSATNKMVQCIVAFGIPLVLTSTTIEPVIVLLLLAYTITWAAVENYTSQSCWDHLRRVFTTLYLLVLCENLTATDAVSFKCLICDIDVHTNTYLFLMTNLRLLIIYSSLLIVYRLMLGTTFQGGTHVVLACFVLSLSALRILLGFTNLTSISDKTDTYLNRHIRINTIALINIVSYLFAMLYALSRKYPAKTSAQAFELTTVD